ncbi:Zinc finger-containing ubiquitin peptidase 1 [Hyphodiscus hymeniophilus]|uniref:Zinc finger-containing ubiquitin peptidase 1 n=1 Tax=Hyphodiscus hymeniophilus TaxID=353542 RepID=A0A9P7AWK5_9HELO|nr:Zinc finger-containing ubiquitin peptidase 1 [Hyphodiscus hymeniophilus]
MEQQIEDCPFCGFKPESEYQIMLHMETYHTEDGPSPFAVKGDDASLAAIMSLPGEENTYAACPIEGCGEAILLTELDSHIEMHGTEAQGNQELPNDSEIESEDEPQSKKTKLKEVQASFGTKLSHALRNLEDSEKSSSGSSPSDRQAKAKSQWKDLLKMPEPLSTSKPNGPSNNAATKNPSMKRRLGKSELGPHANEKQMPSSLVKLLKENDGKLETVNRLGRDNKLFKVRVSINQTPGILPVIEQLLSKDVHTDFAYLCHPTVKHVSKLKGEGGFCGYRNIQMMCSYIIGVESQGCDAFRKKIPSIFEIQEYIEHAWDLGINAHGRVETGGIRGRRVYIGTPDAQAMFCSLDISCDPQAFKPKKGEKGSKGDGPAAFQILFDAVQAYFQAACIDFDRKVRLTSLPPIYFQHPGHSMTIVGFEQKLDGSKNLICFDPMFHDAPNVLRLVGNDSFKQKYPEDMLKAYRRGVKYLRKYNEFEILKYMFPSKLHWASRADVNRI